MQEVLPPPPAVQVPLYGPDWGQPDPDFDAVIAARHMRDFSLLGMQWAPRDSAGRAP